MNHQHEIPYGQLRASIALEVISNDDEPKVLAILDETYVVNDEVTDITLIECYNKAAEIIRG